jgi:hypothetical protein
MRKKIIVDTSVWIQFLNGIESREVSYLREAVLVGELIHLCPIIIQEVLQGIRDDRQYELVKDYLLAFNRLAWEPVAASIAVADLYRSLRKKGITIRKSNDCLIAAFAKEFGLSVLHVDRDFQAIAEAGEILVV